MIFFFFLFNYAATTEIYTDGHTLSLHHALPSCLVEKSKPQDAPSTLSIIGRYVLLPEVFEHLGKRQRGAGGEIQLTDAMARMLGRRSEEHTSELQSLMRISYAVFCLKKKNHDRSLNRIVSHIQRDVTKNR